MEKKETKYFFFLFSKNEKWRESGHNGAQCNVNRKNACKKTEEEIRRRMENYLNKMKTFFLFSYFYILRATKYKYIFRE